jgi:hypothetical protein
MQEKTRRQERKNRDEFRKMLEEHVADGTLNAKTHWRGYCAQVIGIFFGNKLEEALRPSTLKPNRIGPSAINALHSSL